MKYDHENKKIDEKNNPLSQELLQKMNAYWRASQLFVSRADYLYDNPLLKEPLKMSHVKPLVGRTLGYNTRPEFYLRAFEPGHKKV